MRKSYMVLLATILITVSSVAQKGNNQIGVGGDLSIPTGEPGQLFQDWHRRLCKRDVGRRQNWPGYIYVGIFQF